MSSFARQNAACSRSLRHHAVAEKFPKISAAQKLTAGKIKILGGKTWEEPCAMMKTKK